jgi:hypothetical protein
MNHDHDHDHNQSQLVNSCSLIVLQFEHEDSIAFKEDGYHHEDKANYFCQKQQDTTCRGEKFSHHHQQRHQQQKS